MPTCSPLQIAELNSHRIAEYRCRNVGILNLLLNEWNAEEIGGISCFEHVYGDRAKS